MHIQCNVSLTRLVGYEFAEGLFEALFGFHVILTLLIRRAGFHHKLVPCFQILTRLDSFAQRLVKLIFIPGSKLGL